MVIGEQMDVYPYKIYILMDFILMDLFIIIIKSGICLTLF